MGGFSGFRISGSLVTALSSLVLLTSGQAEAAQPSDQHTLPSSCATDESRGLNGYQPVLALGYMATVVTTGTPKTTEQLQLPPINSMRRATSRGQLNSLLAVPIQLAPLKARLTLGLFK